MDREPVAGVEQQVDLDKLRELVLLVAEECGDSPTFGITKLNQIMYCADLQAFGLLGASITGATYRRWDRGPIPDELPALLAEMTAEGEIERIERRYFNRLAKVIVARRDVDRSRFSADELKIALDVIAELRHREVAQVPVLSHLRAGWVVAHLGEVIPYESVLISDRRPTPSEFALWEQDIARLRSDRAVS